MPILASRDVRLLQSRTEDYQGLGSSPDPCATRATPKNAVAPCPPAATLLVFPEQVFHFRQLFFNSFLLNVLSLFQTVPDSPHLSLE
jgi:hypothetical protein